MNAGYRDLIFVEKAGNFVVGGHEAIAIELEDGRKV